MRKSGQANKRSSSSFSTGLIKKSWDIIQKKKITESYPEFLAILIHKATYAPTLSSRRVNIEADIKQHWRYR